MPSPYIELFLADETSNKGEDVLLFWTGPKSSDPEYEVFIEHSTLKKTEDGFVAKPIDSSTTTIEFHFFDNKIAIIYINNGHYIFTVSIRIHPDAVTQFYEYANNRIRLQEISYLNSIQTKEGLGLSENIEGYTATFLSGEKGTLAQQKKKLHNRALGRATRKTRRLN